MWGSHVITVLSDYSFSMSILQKFSLQFVAIPFVKLFSALNVHFVVTCMIKFYILYSYLS